MFFSVTQTPACKKDWTLAQGSCVRVFCGATISWMNAAQACQQETSHLVRIDNAAMNDMIASLNSNRPWPLQGLWIGATDSPTGQWTDVKGVPLTYFNWYTSEPDKSANQHYAYMNFMAQGKWVGRQAPLPTGCYACQYGM